MTKEARPMTEQQPVEAIEQLTKFQQQLDMHGERVGVSRQALDELLAYVATRPTPSPSSDMVEAMARAMALEANDYEGPELQWQYWTDSAQAAATAIASHMAAKDAELAELRAEIEALRTNAKANNDLARMNKAQADEFRAKYVVASETLDFIAPSLPVLRDMLTRAKMPNGASKAAEMIEAVSAALGSAKG